MFIEDWFWRAYLKANPYDKVNSTCLTSNDCKDLIDKSKLDASKTECALIEMLELTSIMVSDYVAKTRTQHCVKKKECNTELTHTRGGYRMFTFCGPQLTKRLTDVLKAAYYNAEISNA